MMGTLPLTNVYETQLILSLFIFASASLVTALPTVQLEDDLTNLVMGSSELLDPEAAELAKDSPEMAFLSRTNMYRCMHGAPPLVWDPLLANSTQHHFASYNDISRGHSNCYGLSAAEGGPAGENLYYNNGILVHVRAAIDSWYREVENCGSLPGCRNGKKGVVGHFTAMVWKGATTLGCAFSDSKRVIACRYGNGANSAITKNTPNMNGAENENVLGIVKTKAACEATAEATRTPSLGRHSTMVQARRVRFRTQLTMEQFAKTKFQIRAKMASIVRISVDRCTCHLCDQKNHRTQEAACTTVNSHVISELQSPMSDSEQCVDLPSWEDVVGNNCIDAHSDASVCDDADVLQYSSGPNAFISATDACCACGGGSNGHMMPPSAAPNAYEPTSASPREPKTTASPTILETVLVVAITDFLTHAEATSENDLTTAASMLSTISMQQAAAIIGVPSVAIPEVVSVETTRPPHIRVDKSLASLVSPAAPISTLLLSYAGFSLVLRG